MNREIVLVAAMTQNANSPNWTEAECSGVCYMGQRESMDRNATFEERERLNAR